LETLKQRIDALSPAKRRLIELRREKGGNKETAIMGVSRQSELLLSFAQQRQWLLNQFAPNSPVYNAPEVLRIRGTLDAEVLERSLNEIVRRHEVLRTTYRLSNNQPTQVIQPNLWVPLVTKDVGNISEEGREAEAKRLVQEEIQRPLDLANGPVLRALLVQLGAGDHFLAVTFHHVAYDGWSKTIFNRELAAIYDAFSEGAPSPLPELPIQYADYAAWQCNRMRGEVLENHLEFWRSHLRGAPPLVALPTDHSRPQATNFEGAHAEAPLSPNVALDLKTLSKREGTTLFTTLLSVLNTLLAHWAQQRDLVIGTVVANRDRVETENLIGCFTNYLPLRCMIAETDTARDVLRHLKKTVLQAFARQDCPFEKIVEDLNPERAASATPFYNVVFLFQNYPETAFKSNKLEAQVLPTLRDASHMDLRIAASETADGIHITCDYRRDLFTAETIRGLLNSYCSLAQQFVSNLDGPVSNFRLTDELAAQANRSHARLRKHRIVVAATFTAEPVEESLRFWMNELEISGDVHFAPFSQVFQQLLDPQSELSRNRSGMNVILVRLEDWMGEQPHSFDALRNSVERNTDELLTSLLTAAGRSSVPYLLCICPAWRKTLANPAIAELFAATEQRIKETLRGDNTIYVVTSSDLAALYPVADYEDPHAYELGSVPYTRDLFTALGTVIARRFYRIHTPPHKVIVLDCDNTLWRGICGEDGATGVEVDAACRALQEFVLAQREAGMLIALCSKNSPDDVWSVFERNPSMILRRDHIASWRINWQAKSQNLRDIASELQLGLDSFIFLDDSAMECAEVETGCPEVLSLQLPAEENELTNFLSHIWAFDHLKVTAEDRQRSDFYAQNTEREQLKQGSASLDDFLATLELQVDIRPMEKSDLARVSQLTQRTNQFNFTTLRRTEAEIEQLCARGAECAVVRVRDRFGDYGLVGAMIFATRDGMLDLDSLLLSCRALGRRVEHRMLAHLGEIATQRDLSRVRIRFVSTERNQPAHEFLAAIGANLEESGEPCLLCWETTSQRLEELEHPSPAMTAFGTTVGEA
jgi:FkbH-like protein